jgi:hypothetical protein
MATCIGDLMPDSKGRFKGTGWTRARAAGWDRAFGGPPINVERLKAVIDYCNNKTTTAPDDRCWKGENAGTTESR